MDGCLSLGGIHPWIKVNWETVNGTHFVINSNLISFTLKRPFALYLIDRTVDRKVQINYIDSTLESLIFTLIK